MLVPCLSTETAFEPRLPLERVELFFLGFYANVAQLVEHILGRDEVTGSIPVIGSQQ